MLMQWAVSVSLNSKTDPYNLRLNKMLPKSLLKFAVEKKKHHQGKFLPVHFPQSNIDESKNERETEMGEAEVRRSSEKEIQE